MQDVIFVAMENWDEVWRRNQPVAAGFARRAPGNKILFVGLSVDVSHALRKGKRDVLRQAFTSQKTLPSPPDYPNIFLLNPTKWLPDTLRWGRAFNHWLYRRQVASACRTLGIQRPLLWMNPHYALHLVGRMDECASVYDIGDDWTQIEQKKWVREQTIADDAALCRRADAVIVVSEHLYALKQGKAQRLYHIPNGVDVERYLPIRARSLPRHPLTETWTGPVLGYTGTLHKDRVNLDLIVATARRFPEATIALVGPVQLTEANTERLKTEPNIRLTGSVPFHEMPQVMSAFDVCIVPHLVTSFTESLSPLKLYEYLASGLPTVSTPISGFRDYPELVHLADNAETFAEGIRAAISEPAALGEQRQRLSRQHSWEARLDAIQVVIETCITGLEAEEKAGKEAVYAR